MKPPQDNTLFAAVSVFSLSDMTSIRNSNVCGKCIQLTTGLGSVVVNVVDVMLRSDASPNDLDLSTRAFSALEGSLDAGVVAGVQWTWVDCGSGSSIQSNPAPAPEALPVSAPEAPPVPVPEALPAQQDLPVPAPEALPVPAPEAPPVPVPEALPAQQDLPVPAPEALPVQDAPETIPAQQDLPVQDAPAPQPNDIPTSAGGQIVDLSWNGWNNVGCLADKRHNRLLSNLLSEEDNMTVELCAQYASDVGYPIFGVEWSVQCWADWNYEDDQRWVDRCSMACAGDSTENCGGHLALNVYQNY
ncbi:hypothetical protein HDU98_007881 [Podochytrium sp. JEL0797]|nr:hypothetical protein HDU98_007881 [Podochytrium sp. JEL0797]